MMGMMKQEMTGINPLMMNMNEMMQNNYAQDEEWMKGFQLGVEEMNSKETIFTTIQGHKTNINVKKGESGPLFSFFVMFLCARFVII